MKKMILCILAVILLVITAGYLIITPQTTISKTGLSSKTSERRISMLRNTTPSYKSPRGWELMWSEDFDSLEIDSRFWTLQTGENYWGNAELQYYTNRPENCFVRDGRLIIRGLKEDYQNSHYTSARITTKGKLDFLYGRIDIKAKLPKGRGLLPAFWLLPSTDMYNDRRRNGEIDIMEMLGHEPMVIYGVAHYVTGDTSTRSYGTYFDQHTDFSQGFHVFSLEWHPERLTWLIDNQPYYSLNLKRTFNDNYKPFTTDFYLIMNLAIGGNWPGNPTDMSIFPAEMEIDYIKYFKKQQLPK